MEVEQRYAIKFFTDEGMPGFEIISRLRMFQAYSYRTMWVASWDAVEEVERPSHFQWKRMLAILLTGTGGYNIAILPAGQR
jgi:hypothetical protein